MSSNRPASVPTEQAHISTLNDLDSSRLSLAKAISDAETSLGSKDAELSALKDEARQLEGYDPAMDHEKELDGATYALLFASSLHIHFFMRIACDWHSLKGWDSILSWTMMVNW